MRRARLAGVGSFPSYRQLDSMDCGPTCLRIVARYYGRRYTLQELRDRSFLNRQGVSLLGISYAAEAIGFRTLNVKTRFEQLLRDTPLPCIAHWQQNHFVVVYKVTRSQVLIADPANGLVRLSHEEFLRGWGSIQTESGPQGTLLLLEPTPRFFEREGEGPLSNSSFGALLRYLRGYGWLFTQVALGMAVASVLQLIFPFLTQAIVDHGIANQDIGFIYLVLLAQLALFFGRTAVEFIRNRILFHVGTRVLIAIVSDFLLKLMKLPISFFDSRMIGDLMQRLQDHARLQQFLTTTTLDVVFSVFTLAVFSVVLAIYSPLILFVFLAASFAYVAYVLIFLRRRRTLDYLRFAQMSRSQNLLVELLSNMQEIKIGNAEKQKRWDWERIQARLFGVNLRSLTLEQAQEGGAAFLNELKNIGITFLAAKLVIDGELTLGMLLAVQYILGQLNAPLAQLVGFMHSIQDARISLERLGEIHERDDEEDPTHRLALLPESKTILLKNVSFHYGGALPKPVLSDVDLAIPEGKVTAIVGVSGSGKTTLVRLLLKFYEPLSGELLVGQTPLRSILSHTWREACGVVMQDGQLFGDTIANNIALGQESVDRERLFHAARMANIHDFVEHLPIGYGTRVGGDGLGMSQGQKQRLLIARAVYKDPHYLFFDEATSALDANNEKVIMDNLQSFFRGRTVVVVAHRLSTVKKADQIVVLDGGRIVEIGTHETLTARKGAYYELVRNQLELGN